MRPKTPNLTAASHCCLTRQPTCFACALQPRPFVFIVVWCIAREADRNGETVKHFRNCIKCFRSFVHHTVQICGRIVIEAETKRCAWQCTDTIVTIFASKFCARKLWRLIALRPSVTIATCRKTCSPQIVLLQHKVKSYLGFQNLGCHCKILGCHFDTQKQLKQHCGTRYLVRRISYDILRRCGQHQWWNTKVIQSRKFCSLCKMRGIVNFGCKQTVFDRRKLGIREKAFWWWSGSLKVV